MGKVLVIFLNLSRKQYGGTKPSLESLNAVVTRGGEVGEVRGGAHA